MFLIPFGVCLRWHEIKIVVLRPELCVLTQQRKDCIMLVCLSSSFAKAIKKWTLTLHDFINMGPSNPEPAEILWPVLLWSKCRSFVKRVWAIPLLAWGLELGTGPGRDGIWTWGLDFQLPHGG